MILMVSTLCIEALPPWTCEGITWFVISLCDYNLCVVFVQHNNTEQVEAEPLFEVVVAIDFGTTSSGYAYAFIKEPECIHIMR